MKLTATALGALLLLVGCGNSQRTSDNKRQPQQQSQHATPVPNPPQPQAVVDAPVSGVNPTPVAPDGPQVANYEPSKNCPPVCGPVVFYRRTVPLPPALGGPAKPLPLNPDELNSFRRAIAAIDARHSDSRDRAHLHAQMLGPKLAFSADAELSHIGKSTAEISIENQPPVTIVATPAADTAINERIARKRQPRRAIDERVTKSE